jgi:hypothetical protein
VFASEREGLLIAEISAKFSWGKTVGGLEKTMEMAKI